MVTRLQRPNSAWQRNVKRYADLRRRAKSIRHEKQGSAVCRLKSKAREPVGAAVQFQKSPINQLEEMKVKGEMSYCFSTAFEIPEKEAKWALTLELLTHPNSVSPRSLEIDANEWTCQDEVEAFRPDIEDQNARRSPSLTPTTSDDDMVDLKVRDVDDEGSLEFPCLEQSCLSRLIFMSTVTQNEQDMLVGLVPHPPTPETVTMDALLRGSHLRSSPVCGGDRGLFMAKNVTIQHTEQFMDPRRIFQ